MQEIGFVLHTKNNNGASAMEGIQMILCKIKLQLLIQRDRVELEVFENILGAPLCAAVFEEATCDVLTSICVPCNDQNCSEAVTRSIFKEDSIGPVNLILT